MVTVADYEQRLRDHYVILSAEERRARIQNQFAATRVKSDPALLETLVYLTEYPTPITGGFDPQFLELPEEVLVTVMRHHQKYFSVEDAEGKLAPQFVAVMNIPADPEGFVRSGNERVLRARFNDARFFWETDQKKKLVDRVPIWPTSLSRPSSAPISKRPSAPSRSLPNWAAMDSRSAPRKCSSATSPRS